MANKYTSIGGQALIEGIMMKSPEKTALCVRLPDGSIDTSYMNEKKLADKHKIFGLPIIRGVVGFVEAMLQGYKALMIAADKSGFTDFEEEKPTTTVTEKEPEKPKEEVNPIIFDTTLNFDKGYTTNNDELYQTTAFKPTSTEGVIKCENIKAYKTSTYLEKGIVYIYYRDSRAKKVIISSNQQYNSSSAYNNGVASYAVLKQQIEANKNTEVLIRTSQKDKLIQANILINMAYGKTLKFDGTNLNYYVVFSYDAPINDAMNKILNNQVNRGNMACSTIVSTDASI